VDQHDEEGHVQKKLEDFQDGDHAVPACSLRLDVT
jgi:hypothetical protein